MSLARKIILKPKGGLCNRLRSIDSFITLCNQNSIDLDVLWTLDESLNAPFSSLFEPLEFNAFHFRLIDVPKGFPELLLENEGKFGNNSGKTVSIVKKFIKSNMLKLKLNKVQNEVVRELNCLSSKSIILNDELSQFYNSNEQIHNSIRVMDLNFIDKVQVIFNDLLANNETIYVESCYRVFKLESFYNYLKPVKSIIRKINDVTSAFNEITVGLHIRRSDHKTSKQVSTEDKFLNIVEKEISINQDINFFISTDDPVTKHLLEDKYGSKIISQKVSSYSRDDKNAIIDAVVDLYSLSKTHKIYGSHHSSFSQTAADLVQKEEIIL